MKPKSGSVRVQKCLRCNLTGQILPLKRAIFATKQDKPLIIKTLTPNYIKSRIFAFLRARESLIENTRVLEGIVVKIFDSYHCFSFYHFSFLLY